MASNNDFVVPAGPNARRFAVFDVSDRYAFNGDCPEGERKAYFDALWGEGESGGREAMLFALLRRDLTWFHPRKVLQTAALNDLKQLSMGDLARTTHTSKPSSRLKPPLPHSESPRNCARMKTG